MYDLLIRNATLIDPAQHIHACKDVVFADGRIAADPNCIAKGVTTALVCHWTM